MGEVLLFSAGLDSFPAWYYLNQPPALYFDLGHRYAAQECTAIAALAHRCRVEVTISEELRLGAWEAEDAIIPLRNAYLAMLAGAACRHRVVHRSQGRSHSGQEPAGVRRDLDVHYPVIRTRGPGG